MRLIGPKCDQLGPIHIVYLKSPNEKTNSFCLHKTGVLMILKCFITVLIILELFQIGFNVGPYGPYGNQRHI